MVIDANGHTFTSVVTPPTCTEQGYTTHTCHCGYAYVDAYVDANGHEYTSVVTPPTCTQQGYTTHTCHCGYAYVDAYVDANGHEYTSVVTPPTCTQQGYTTHTCHCGSTYADTYVEAFGHSYNDWYVTLEPNCTEAGTERHDCTNCDHYEEQIVPAIGHSCSSTLTPPTCTEPGYSTYTCHCGYTYVDTYVDALGHNFENCVCSVCGYSNCLSFTLLRDGTYSVKAKTSKYLPAELSLPANYMGIPVSTIADSAFRNCSQLTSVTIPDGIKVIGKQAFSENPALIHVEIGSDVTTINSKAFENCSGIKSLSIPDRVTYIGTGVLSGCSSLESLDLPFVGQSVNATISSESTLFGYIFGTRSYSGSINIRQYYSANDYKEYYIPKSLMSVTITGGNILYGAFSYCSNLTNITLHDGITNIGDSAFAYCESLTSITIPDSVKSIGKSAFSWCIQMRSIAIGLSVEEIGSNAFNACNKLVEVINHSDLKIEAGSYEWGNIANNAIEVHDKASKIVNKDGYLFYAGDTNYLLGYEGSDTIVLPESYEGKDYRIHNNAFYRCQDLQSITIPDLVTGIGDNTFSHCSSLKNITIGVGCKSIGDSAFSFCSNLTSIAIGDGCTYIGDYAFSYTALKSITIGDGPTIIGNYAFSNCTSLKSVRLGEGTTSIGQRSFEKCQNLTDIVVPNSVTSIGARAFDGCSSLYSITLPFVGSSAFASSASESTLFGYIFGTSSFTNSVAVKQYYTGNNYKTYYIPIFLDVTVTGGNLHYGAFSNCDTLSAITLEEGVRDIGERAFYNCSEINSITIPHSTTSIGKNAFYGCTDLKSVFIGNGVKEIGDYAFGKCTALADIEVGNSVTYIPSFAFSGCTNLIYTIYDNAKYLGNSSNPYLILMSAENKYIKNCSIHKDTKVIQHNAFGGCMNLTNITIPDGVYYIGEYAFRDCTALSSIVIPDSVMYFFDTTFYQCTALRYNKYDHAYYIGNEDNPYLVLMKAENTNITSCHIHPNAKIIYRNAFEKCTGLTSMTIPEGLGTIGAEAFKNCSGLSNLSISDGVTNIGERAFYGCRNLKSITVPDSVKHIGLGAFGECTSLETIILPFVGANADEVKNDGSKLFAYIFGTNNYSGSHGVTCTLNHQDYTYYVPNTLKSVIITGGEIIDDAFYNCRLLTSITIPDHITRIGSRAFYRCASLSSVTLNPGVTSIGDSAFFDCIGLKSMTLPDGITDIGQQAFAGCTGLTRVVLGYGLTSIGASVFSNCSSLTEISIPDSVTSIEIDAFYRCSALTEIKIPENVTSIGAYAFRDCSGLSDITIPDSVIDIEYYSFAGCTGLNKIILGSGLTSIGQSVFKDCTHLTGIIFPDNIEKIGMSAFSGCTALENVKFGNGLTTIGDCAFAWTGLTNIIIPDNVVDLGVYAFEGCAKLKTVVVGNGVSRIGSNTFYLCSELENIVLPDSVTSIGDYAFDGCSKLSQIDIPDSVTAIGKYAFRDCIALASITVPDGVTSVEEYTFYQCIGLKSVTLGESVTSIGQYAFWGCTNLKDIHLSTALKNIHARAFYNCPGLKYVFYTGTYANWNAISIQSMNTSLTSAYLHTESRGHSFGEWAVEIAPTCTETGIYAHSCDVCGEKESVIMPATGHDFGPWAIDIPATCTQEGKRSHICVACNYKETEVIPASGHSVEEWTVHTLSTCTQKGERSGICSVCVELVIEEIPAMGHTSGKFISLEEYCGGQELGYTQCIDCGATLSEFEHRYKTTVTHSTCHTQGQIVYACINCQNRFTITLPVGGHIMSDWTVTIPATCTNAGELVRTCINCLQVIDTRSIDPIAHSYTSQVTNQGVVYTCSQCRHTYTVETTEYVTLSFICDGKKILNDLQIAKGIYSALPVPTKDGYVFSGWYLDENLTNSCLDTYSFGTNTTLYSTWIEESITEKISSNNLATNAPLTFTFQVNSEIPLTDSNLAQYVWITDINGQAPALSIVSRENGIYTIGSSQYEPGMTYSVLLDEQVSFVDVSERELWFITERENTCNIWYNSQTILLPETAIYAGYESEGNKYILMQADELNAGDNVVVYHGNDQFDITMVFCVVAEGSYQDLYFYSIDEADPDVVFEKLDYYYSGDLDVENITFNANLNEDLTQQVLQSSLYARFNYAATAFSGVVIGEYYYDLNNTPKPKVSFKAKDDKVTFTIKIVAEFARMHVDTREVDSLFTVTMEITSELSFDFIAQIDGLSSASMVATVNNTTKVNILASNNDKQNSKQELSYFKKLLEAAKKIGSFKEVDASKASNKKEVVLGTLPIVGIPGISLSLNLSNVFDFEAVGELGVEAQMDVSVKFGLQYVAGQGVSAIKSFDAEARVSMYLMGMINIAPSLKLELKATALGMLNAYINASIGSYMEIGGIASVTLSTTGVNSAVAGGFLEIGIKIKSEMGVNAKVQTWLGSITLFDTSLTLFSDEYMLLFIGEKKVPLYFITPREEISLIYNCGTCVDLSQIADTSTQMQDFNSMKKSSEKPSCSYYLNGDYPGITLSTNGILYVERDVQGETISVKITYGQVYKIVELNITVAHNILTSPYIPPTCTEFGNTEYRYCSECDEIFEGENRQIEALGHHLGDWYVYSAVTCISQGVDRRDCSGCKYYETRTIEATGHADDNFDKVCDNCKQQLSPGLYDASGNQLASWEELLQVYGMDAEKNYTSATYNTDPASPSFVLANHAELSEGTFLVLGDVDRIGDYAFYKNVNLTGISLSFGVTSIGKSAFAESSALTNVSIPGSVTSIGDRAFNMCENLNKVVIGYGVQVIGEGAFAQCSSLTQVTLPDSVTHIDFAAFKFCYRLKDVSLSNCLTSIGRDAFWGCSALSEINIPDSVTSMGDSAFAGTGIVHNEYGDSFYLGNHENPYRILTQGYALCTIHPDTKIIADNAIWGCNLKSIVIPHGVTHIGASAFSGCQMTDITIPDSVVDIGPSAFYGCSMLTSVTIPGSVISIGYAAFEDCSRLKSVSLGDGIKSIGDWAFYFCISLESITIPDSVTSIGIGAFSECHSLMSATLGRGMTHINEDTFNFCNYLSYVFIPDTITSIGEEAFGGCESLNNLFIPDSVTAFGYWSFVGCSNLKTVYYEGSVEDWCNIENLDISYIHEVYDQVVHFNWKD